MSREYVLKPDKATVELQIDYAGELNEQQHAAVTAPPGPALVIAGAGSGKTRTLTYRVAFLLEQGIPPERILLLTFTNKAAREMMRRVADLLGSELSALWGGTFHSIGARVLRRHAEAIGYQSDFTIMDREDARELLKACVGEMDIDVKETRFPKADVLADIFSLAVNKEKSVADILEEQFGYFTHLAAPIAEAQRKYTARKQAANAMDFDDLLVLWLKLLRDNAEAREHYQRRFQFILVDEYQDTNRIQGELIDILAARHSSVMVVGDDSQSIYSWRGAEFLNILDFPKRYPGAKIYKIETNYRSTPEILAVANAAIAANVRQFAKQLTPARPGGEKPIVVTCGDSGEQAAFVAQRVLELREEGIGLDRMSVLSGSHFAAREVGMEFTRRNIPLATTSGIRFFEQAHVKDVAAFIKFVANPRDELSFKRMIRLLPGVGEKSADRLWLKFAAEFATPAIGEIKADNKRPIGLAAAFQRCGSGAPKKTTAAWAQLSATLAQLASEPVFGKPSQMIRLVLDAVYEDYLQEQYANFRQRLEDLEQLGEFALRFQNLEEFLTQLALMTGLEAEEERPANKDDEQIRLSTIHQAKGLEFDVVFVIMLCDGLFPSARSMDLPEGEEEERRLFYVAVTRAKSELYLSYPLMRVTPGGGGDVFQQASRFLGEIPKDLVEEWNLRPFDPYR